MRRKRYTEAKSVKTRANLSKLEEAGVIAGIPEARKWGEEGLGPGSGACLHRLERKMHATATRGRRAPVGRPDTPRPPDD